MLPGYLTWIKNRSDSFCGILSGEWAIGVAGFIVAIKMLLDESNALVLLFL